LKATVVKQGYPASADPAHINTVMTVLLLWLLVIYVTLVYAPIAAWLVELFPTRIRYSGLSLPYHIGNGWFGASCRQPCSRSWHRPATSIRPVVSDRSRGRSLVIGLISCRKRATSTSPRTDGRTAPSRTLQGHTARPRCAALRSWSRS